jgi:hypothetical protein
VLLAPSAVAAASVFVELLVLEQAPSGMAIQEATTTVRTKVILSSPPWGAVQDSSIARCRR